MATGYFSYTHLKSRQSDLTQHVTATSAAIQTANALNASTSTPINPNTCDSQYQDELEGVIRCDTDDNLVFVYTPEKKAEIIKKIDNQVINTFYSYENDDVSDENSDFTF